jgi:hypothetical protein
MGMGMARMRKCPFQMGVLVQLLNSWIAALWNGEWQHVTTMEIHNCNVTTLHATEDNMNKTIEIFICKTYAYFALRVHLNKATGLIT